jgi:hypothetical protein
MKQYLTYGLLFAVILSGCAKETSLPTPTGEGSIRAINAISGTPEVAFLIEERLIGAIGYRESSNTVEYDDLTYTFNFDAVLAGDQTRTRVASQFIDVQTDIDYTLVISGSLDAPDVSVWEADRREWAGTETVFELRAAHLSESLGAVDIYFSDAATPPTLGSQFATLAAGEVSASGDLEAGDYVVTVTPAGDDSTTLFVSESVSVTAQSQFMVSVFDTNANDLAPVSARLYELGSGNSLTLVDTRFPPQLRFIHASLNLGSTDIYVEDPLVAPLVANHNFKDVTGFFDVEAIDLPVTYTAAGNVGSILLEDDRLIIAGTRADYYVVRDPDGVDIPIVSISDRSSISTFARINIINTDPGRAAVDVYLVPSGEPLDDEQSPFIPLLPSGIRPILVTVAPNDYDIYVTEVTDQTILAGPVPLTLDFGDVAELVIFETADPSILDIELIASP